MTLKSTIFNNGMKAEAYYEKKPSKDGLLGRSKVTQLKNLKYHGTLIRHKTPEAPTFVFNSFNLENNPCVDFHDSETLRIQLLLSQDTCYLPGIFTQQESLAATTTIARSAAGEEMLRQSKSVLAGVVLITVKGQSGILFQDLRLQLSGYSTEYVCLMQFGEKVVRLLKDIGGTEHSSSLQPMIRETMQFETKLKLLSPGSYTYPFNFVLDPYHHHASIDTHLGSTQYRMEFVCTVMKQKSNYETIFLSKSFTVKKTLPPGNLLRYDSFESRGSWRDGLLDYEIYLSSKLLEFDQPFQFHLNLLKGDMHKVEVNTVELVLEQNILIPCIKKKNLSLSYPKSKSYMSTNNFFLEKRTIASKQNIQHLLQFSSLVISSNKHSMVLNRSLYPYYCEINDTFGTDRCKLKVTHVLKAQISLKLTEDTQKTLNMMICLKLPVLLVDQDMCSSLHLPPYQEFCPSSNKDLFVHDASTSLSAPTEHTSSSDFSPPSYDELYDTLSWCTNSSTAI